LEPSRGDIAALLLKRVQKVKCHQEVRDAKDLVGRRQQMNRNMLSQRLERKGYEVIAAPDDRQGLELARSKKPALILMDMSLPELDGWEAKRQLKAEPETQPIPVIALTAHTMVSDRERAYAAGCDDYDTKPVELNRLLDKIERLLGQRSPE
jgi:two-component system cell cycle response regulator DivK